MRLLTFTLLFVTSLSFSQKDSTELTNKKLEHSLGLTFGTTTGVGPTYRLITPSGFGFHVNFMPMIDLNKSQSSYKEKDFLLGLNFYFNFHEFTKARIFVYQSNVYQYDNYEYYYDRYDYHDPYIFQYDKVELYHGIGFGVEWKIKDRGGFTLMGGMGAYRDFETIAPTIETGIFYKL